jgi:hypothetical protein
MHEHHLDKEYCLDYLKWQQFLVESHSNSSLGVLANCIDSRRDPLLACFFAIEKQYQLPIMQKIVLNSEDPKYAFLFAKTIKNADVNSLQQLVINSNNILYITKFACFIPNNNIKILENLIFNSKKIKYIHMLFLYNKNINFDRYKKYILSHQSPKYLFELAKHVDNEKDLIKIEDAIIASGSAKYIRLLASKIKNTNISKLEEAILATNNLKEIKNFAKLVKNSSMKNFLIV